MDWQKKETELTKKLRAFFRSAGRKKAILGLSGGLDSSVALGLCVKALGKENMRPVFLPTPATPASARKHVSLLAKKYSIRIKEISLTPLLSACQKQNFLPPHSKLALGNLTARLRMLILYAIAERERGLVIGTSDKSELALGYFTKWGDGAADVLPLGSLYKTEVRQLARHLGLAKEIAEQPPSPHLWKGQSAGQELGFSYEEIDPLLKELEKGAGKNEAALKRKFGPALVARVLALEKMNRHKKSLAPVL